MKELSLHILDITQNSIKANASLVEMVIDENVTGNRLTISIVDNGDGIPEDKIERITNPFVTSRTTRKVGLGLSLFKAAADACNGYLTINSQVGEGTRVEVAFDYNHIDRAPLGDMPGTVITMLMSFNNADLVYKHRYNGAEFIFDTREIKEILQEDSLLGDPEILNWIQGFVTEGLEEITEA